MSRLLATLAAAVVLLWVVAGPAGATSCAADPGATADNMLAGRPVHGAPLFERFDLAVVGTVKTIQTNEAAGGATRTTMDVHAGFNVAEVPATLAVSSSDPGWMNGYAFEHGQTYFIPLQHPGPSGEPHYSMVCDPIFVLAGPDAAGGLVDIAAANDVPVAQVVDAPAASSVSPSWPVAAVVAVAGAAVLAVAAVVGLATLSARRRHPA